MIFSSSHVWMWGLDHKEKVRRKWKWSRSVMSDSLDPMDCSLWGSSVHGIFQARVLEWIAISFSRGSSWPSNRTWVSHIAGRLFTVWAWAPKNWCFWIVVLEKTLESPLDCKEIQPVNPYEISPEYSLEGLMLKLKLQYFGHWCKELPHWKRSWCWERLKGGGEGDDRGWDGWIASSTQWTWVWASSGNWWWTGKPGMLQSMRLQRAGHNWAAKLASKIYPKSTSSHHIFHYYLFPNLGYLLLR